MLDGLNFKEFVAFLAAFSPRTKMEQKIECKGFVYIVDFVLLPIHQSVLKICTCIFCWRFSYIQGV